MAASESNNPPQTPRVAATVAAVPAAIASPDALAAALKRDPMVLDCVALARADEQGRSRLIAYVVPAGAASSEQLAARCRAALPDALQPDFVVPLAALPIDARGHVDRDALARLPVLTADLAQRVDALALALPGIDHAASLLLDQPAPTPRLHLDDLLPPGHGLDLAHTATAADAPASGSATASAPDAAAPAQSASAAAAAPGAPAAAVPSLTRGEPIRLAPDAPRHLAQALAQAAAQAPARGVTFIRPGAAPLERSYAQILDEARVILSGLRRLGLKPGDKALFQLEANEDFVPAFWACALGGIVPVPISIAPGYQQVNATLQKLANGYELCDRPPVLASDNLVEPLRRIAPALGLTQLRVVPIGELRGGTPAPDLHEPQSGDLALLLLTSGSTGLPKAVMLSHANLLARSAASIQFDGFTPDDVSLNWLPLDHVGGIVMWHVRDVLTRCRQVLAPASMILESPLLWIDLLDRYRVTTTWAPNFAFGLVNDHAGEIARRRWDLSATRFILNGGEAIVARTARRFLELLEPHGLPPTAMRPAWGMSETSSGISSSHHFSRAASNDADRFVEVGPAMPGSSFRIVDQDEKVVPEGATGRLQVTGPTVTSGYYRNPGANAESFTPDGWFNTGDLAVLRQGRLTITGRAKDVIIINGANYACHEIESVVESVPGVLTAHAAACAVRDPQAQTDRLAIFLVADTRDQAELGEILQQVRRQVAHSVGVSPDHIVPVERSQIPKTAIGKIQRTQMQKQFEAGAFADRARLAERLLGSGRTIPDWFFRRDWTPRAAEAVGGSAGASAPEASAGPRAVLLYDDASALGDALCERLGARGARVIRVRPGRGELAPGDQPDLFRLDPADARGPERLVRDLVARGVAIDLAVHAWGAAPPPVEPAAAADDSAALDAALDRDCTSVLFLAQALALAQGPAGRARLRVVARGAQCVEGDPAPTPARAAAAAMLKSLALEMPALDPRHIDLEPAPQPDEPGLLLDEIQFHGGGQPEVAFRGGRRLVAALAKIDLAPGAAGTLPWVRGGFYLITGGLGGIGRALARWLLRAFDARLLLVGRSPLPPRDQWEALSAPDQTSPQAEALRAFRSLLAASPHVAYEALDVADRAALTRATDAAQARFSRPLDGVVHLAGLYRETPAAQETRESFLDSLRPKIHGGAALASLLGRRPGALFVAFSSVAGVLGADRNAAYAAANAGLDALALALRRQGVRALAIQWSMWDEVGMSRGYRAKAALAANGILRLTSAQGLASFALALARDLDQVVVGLDASAAFIRRRTRRDAAPAPLRVFFSARDARFQRDALDRLAPRDAFGAAVPLRWSRLAALPLDARGQVDRARLALAAAGAAREHVAPRNPLERTLADAWQEVLGVESIGVHDNFFELGGHSLLGTKLVARLRQSLAVELTLRDLFEDPTVAGLALRLGSVAGERRAAIPLAPRDARLPLSFAQQQLWFLSRMGDDRGAYNIPAAIRFTGPLNLDALRQGLQDLVARHEALRTRFPDRDGSPAQVIEPTLHLDLPLEDLSAVAAGDRDAQLQRRCVALAKAPFDLAHGPVVRANVLRVAPEDHTLFVTMHHIVSDGWSMNLFFDELAACYAARAAGRSPELAPAPIQYADYAAWQRSPAHQKELEPQLDYWRRQLANCPAGVELPTDRPRPAVHSFRGDRVVVEMPAHLADALEALARRHDATLYMTLLAAYETLLFRYTRAEDILIGTVSANRGLPELEPVMGFFVNLLVLRCDLSGNPAFTDLLARVRQVTLDAFAHQSLPFETLVERLQPERSLSLAPFFQLAFELRDSAIARTRRPGMDARIFEDGLGTAKYDLRLTLERTESGLSAAFEFNSDLFEPRTIRRFAGYYRNLLEAVAADPSRRIAQLPLIDAAQRRDIVSQWASVPGEYDDQATIHQIFERRADAMPDAPAVIHGSRSLTYAQLDRRANQLAHRLRQAGVGRESIVALCVDRGIEMVVGIMGIIKAGAAYLPLDPAYPVDRLAFMLQDSDARILLTQAHLVAGLPPFAGTLLRLDADAAALDAMSDARPPLATSPQSLAYVIYTSGSTGKPKGVMLRHRGLVNLAAAQRRAFSVTPESRVLQFSPFSFDASVWEVFMALGSGAAIVMADRPQLLPGPDLLALLRDQRVSIVTLPPSVLSAMPQADLPDLRTIISAGEPCTVPIVRRWAPGRLFINAYGPTEVTVCATLGPCDPASDQPPSIGRPLDNARCYILDDTLDVVPVGVVGELFVGGPGVARGYHNRPELTAERFLPDPFSADPADRLYRTGDLARWRPDGTIDFLGRVDHQVKVRGFRIELGEIESALLQNALVEQAIVLGRDDGPDNKQIVAYVTLRAAAAASADPADATPRALREHLRRSLPEHMVPGHVLVLDAMPMTPNGKIDRKALPAPGRAAPRDGAPAQPPRNDLERAIDAAWRAVLQIDHVGLDENFFDVGGHSLRLVQLQNRLRDALGRELPLVLLFQFPTIAGLAVHLAQADAGALAPQAPGAASASAPGGPAPDPAKSRQGQQRLAQQLARRRAAGGPGETR